ncbi:MAG: hypothetical protein JF628_08460 [Sphingomonas sp.]|nr:hypothetical protein [Sphingomonas sp.]
MFIRPNEFETQLATVKPGVPVYRKSHRAAGTVFLMVAIPVLAVWWAVLTCWALGTAILRAPLNLTRFFRDVADYSGWLVKR